MFTEKDEFIILKDTQFEALVRILQQKEIYEKSIQYLKYMYTCTWSK